VAQRSAGDAPEQTQGQAIEFGVGHDGGLLQRGVHTKNED
jgi:hypothetical protein